MTPLTHAWKKRIFSGDPILRPEARIRRQVDGIGTMLGLKHRARVLDMGCGAGSQTIELARRKYRVVGMEASPEALAGARDRARAESLTVHFLLGDMRRIPYSGEFDAVINLRNPIGCFASERDDERGLAAAAQALVRGGKLLLDLLNREWLIRRLGMATRAEMKDQAFDLKTGRLDGRVFSARGGGAAPAGHALRIYSLTEVIRMLDAAGLGFSEVYGDYDRRVYGVDSLRMIVVAEKPRERAREPRPADALPSAVRIKGRPR